MTWILWAYVDFAFALMARVEDGFGPLVRFEGIDIPPLL
jgi:hypothetical protein